MTVPNISSNSYSFLNATQQSSFKQRAEDFKALQSALQSNDLSGAQQAFASLQKDMPGLAQASNSTSTNSSSPRGQLSQDFQSLQSALQSGDLSSAQQAFATLQQDVQSARKGHHHHHSQDNSTTTPVTTTTPSSTPTLNQLA